MRSFVASDDPTVSAQIRDVLLRLGHDCPASNIAPLDSAIPTLNFVSEPATRGAPPALPENIFVTLGAAPERSLACLRDLRKVAKDSHMFVVGPTTDARMAIRALREGADEFLDQADIAGELTSALDRIKAESGATGRLISILSPSGGGGASTIAANLAVTLAQKHASCGLLDLKLLAGDLASFLDLKPNYSIADLCQYAERLDRSLLEGALLKHASGVQLLPAPNKRTDLARVTPEGVTRVLAVSRLIFPYVVADVDRSFAAEQAVVLTASDLVVLVMRLDFTSLRNVRRTLEYFEEIGVPKDKVRVVANRFGQYSELPTAKVEEALSLKIANFLPEDPKTVNRATNHGQPAVLEAPKSHFSKALVELSTQLQAQVQAAGK